MRFVCRVVVDTLHEVTEYAPEATSGPYVFTINAQVFARALSRSLNILNIYYFYDSILYTLLRVCVCVCSGAHGRRAPATHGTAHAVHTLLICACEVFTLMDGWAGVEKYMPFMRWAALRWEVKILLSHCDFHLNAVNPHYENASHVFQNAII